MVAELSAAAAGLGFGVALLLFVRAFRRPTPDLHHLLLLRAGPAGPNGGAAGPPVAPIVAPVAAGVGESASERVGRALLVRSRRLPGWNVPYADLDILGKTPAGFAAEKLVGFLVGLLLLPLVGLFLAAVGIGFPLVVPAVLSLGLAAAGWMFPHLAARRDAGLARDRFSRTITSYYDLVALSRLAGSGMEQALNSPTLLCQAPLFLRIRQALERQRLERRFAYQGLQRLAREINVPQLGDLADIIELNSTKGAPAAATLLARAGDIRNNALNRDVEKAAAASQRQIAFTAMLLVCFLAFLIFPVLVRIIMS